MYQDHPNLSDEINANIRESELQGGVFLKNIPVGGSLQAQTKNTLYLLEHRPEGWFISGNARFCPTPTKANIHGSTWGGSMLKIGFVGRGMYMEFSTDVDRNITTTEISWIRETKRKTGGR